MPTLKYREPGTGIMRSIVSGTNDHGQLAGLADNDHPQYVLKTGDIMTGPLTIPKATSNNHAVNREQVWWAGSAAGGTVSRPWGGLRNGAQFMTGYLIVALPASAGAMMGHFSVKGFDYAPTGGSAWSLSVGGYTYSPAGTPGWYNTSISAQGEFGSAGTNPTVRFLALGTSDPSTHRFAIAIGESTTVWNYPQIAVFAEAIGFTGYAGGLDDCAVSISTSLSGWTTNISRTPVPPTTDLTLVNGWSVYPGTWGNPGYTKINGIVYLSGLMKRDAGVPAGGSVIANLPSGYRPSMQMIFNQYTDTGAGRLDITAAGDLVYLSGGVAYYSLAGIVFPARG